jgi:hypothetical protein
MEAHSPQRGMPQVTVLRCTAGAPTRWGVLAIAALTAALVLLPGRAGAAQAGTAASPAVASGPPPERIAVPGLSPLREPAAPAGELELRYASPAPVEAMVSLQCGHGETGREPVYLSAGSDKEVEAATLNAAHIALIRSV